MPNPHFIGLSLLASAEAALAETHSPLASHLARDGLLARRTAERSLALLEMLQHKTLGSLDDTERATLERALPIPSLRRGLEAA